ncbi:Glycosyl transferase family 2 [Soonwooa buanensis]|uniref:Glycosyl transferase family 2 n=2 Tax=Soonwooa buanensis TaxID=619805 RepID=A0A1T5EBH0_9FLAO|nr:Glycosyl transferase family 2 [Soonwooa buanensis]
MKYMNPLVSIIIPVFKVEEFIRRCILSVINQTYQNIECLVVDDQSPDNSINIVKDIISEFSDFEIKIITQPQNMGLSMARNAGIDVAKGKYMYFLDSDDEITPNAIKQLVDLAEKTNAELTLGHCLCINEAENWTRDYFPIKSQKDFLKGNTEILNEFINGEYPVMACDKLVRRDFVLKNQLYFVQDLFSQDVLWSFQSALKLESVAFLREDTYLYYFHSASIIHNRGEKHFGNWITIANYMNQAYLNENNEDRKQLILRYLVDFKVMTLQMNWKAQKNKALWKRSYDAYSRLKGLSIFDYFSSKYSTKLKKENFYISLPTNLGYKLFRKRFGD